jgi:transcriptional regulator with XRE-family HTH domain
MKQTLPPGRRGKRRAGPWDKEVGRRIRALRLEKGMSQGKLAGQLDLSFQQLQKYEKGTNRVGAGRLQQIAEALGVPVAFFFDGDASRAPPGSETESMFGAVQSLRAVRMLRAFNRIQDAKIQLSLITLAEHMSDRA